MTAFSGAFDVYFYFKGKAFEAKAGCVLLCANIS